MLAESPAAFIHIVSPIDASVYRPSQGEPQCLDETRETQQTRLGKELLDRRRRAARERYLRLPGAAAGTGPLRARGLSQIARLCEAESPMAAHSSCTRTLSNTRGVVESAAGCVVSHDRRTRAQRNADAEA